MFGYVLDDIFIDHRAPSGHPERPARAEAVRDALVAAGIASQGTHVATRVASDAELAAVHGASYLSHLERVVPGKTGWLDPDTYFSPGTWNAALSAAGSTSELATRVMSGELSQGIAVVRPPGHHATRDQAMGFCLLNNVAVAAAAARSAGAARVAIVDWDVHHGNGTQDIFWDDPNVLYMSVHQFPYYPGTGAPTEIGGAQAIGATINVGLPGGSRDPDYAAVFDHVFLPAIEKFKPDLLFISAGFDAFEHDPLAGMRVTHAGFAHMARRLRYAAERSAGGRIVAVLEGGYDLDGLAGGMTSTLRALTEPAPSSIDLAPLPTPDKLSRAAIDGTLAAHAQAGSPIPAPEDTK
ncbi:MAG: histone deacetylase [Kofleriaceae bacterium]|nr:histone deacetylase [Kofleriaceae bacterium]